MVLATAVFEYFPSQIAVAGAGFAGFNCHQTTDRQFKRGAATVTFCDSSSPYLTPIVQAISVYHYTLHKLTKAAKPEPLPAAASSPPSYSQVF